VVTAVVVPTVVVAAVVVTTVVVPTVVPTVVVVEVVVVARGSGEPPFASASAASMPAAAQAKSTETLRPCFINLLL